MCDCKCVKEKVIKEAIGNLEAVYKNLGMGYTSHSMGQVSAIKNLLKTLVEC